jgi:GTP-binding protein EngB required for normal cell division
MEGPPRHFLVVGYSQNGKSSYINFFVKDAQQKGKVGTAGQGLCCTQSIDFYNCSHPDLFDDERVVFVDTIGLGDTLLKSKKEIQTAIIQSLTIEGISKLDGIIIIEAVTNSTITLPKVTEFLIEMFGPTVTRSAIVLATKSNAVVVKEELEERLSELEGLKKKLSLAGLMIFTTPYQYLESSAIKDFDTQTEELGRNLLMIPPLDLTTITQDTRLKLEQKANEIRNTGKKEEVVDYTVEKVRHESRTRHYTVEHTEWIFFVPVKHSRTVHESYTVPIVYNETLSKTVTVYPEMEECLVQAKEEIKSSIIRTLQGIL